MFKLQGLFAALLTFGLTACGNTNFGAGGSADAIKSGASKTGKNGKGGSDAADGADAGDGADEGKEGAGDGAGHGKDGADDGDGNGSNGAGDSDGGEGKDGKDGKIDGDGDEKLDEPEEFDGAVTGFRCPANMKEAVGKWEGTWTGVGSEGLLSGTVTLRMEMLTKKSLQVREYQIKGGYVGRGNQIETKAFDFILSCNDAAFAPVIVEYVDGKPYYAVLQFTHQTWGPATLRGIGVGGAATPKDFNVGGGGTWNMHKT